MLLRKKELNTLILGLFFILMCHVMYLINIIDGFWILLFVLFFGLSYLKYFRIKVNKSGYTSVIFLGLVMILFSSFMAHYNVGQPIILGIDGQKIFLIILLSYFPLRKLFSRELIDFELLEKIILGMGIVECFVYIGQHYLYPKVVFLNCMINVRNGARIYADTVIVELMIMIAFSRLLKDPKNKIKNGILLSLGMFYEFVVAQGRLECMAILFVLLCSFLIYKGHSGKKLFFGSLIAIFVIWLFNSDLFNAFMTTQYNTMEIRDVARELYYSRLLSSPENFLFGYGYLTSHFSDIVRFAGAQKEIYIVDNGIFGFVYSYGILGVFFAITIFLRSMKLALKCCHDRGELLPFMFTLLNIILSYNIVFWWWKSEWIFSLVILICYLEMENSRNDFIIEREQ